VQACSVVSRRPQLGLRGPPADQHFVPNGGLLQAFPHLASIGTTPPARPEMLLQIIGCRLHGKHITLLPASHLCANTHHARGEMRRTPRTALKWGKTTSSMMSPEAICSSAKLWPALIAATESGGHRVINVFSVCGKASASCGRATASRYFTCICNLMTLPWPVEKAPT
jgi:hypothetical protein